MLVSKTTFNKEALKNMTFKEFEKIYKGKFQGNPDLKKVFASNGGKLSK